MLHSLRQKIVVAAAVGIVKHYDQTLLESNGGFLKLDTKWTQSLLHRMNMVKKKGTKASRTLPDNFSDQTAKFLAETRKEVEKGRIPGDLIIDIDRMGIKIVPCSEWALDVKGSKQVAITGLHHK